MIKMSQNLKKYIDIIQSATFRNKHSCLLQKNRMNRYIAKIQIYEQKCERSTVNPVKIIRSIKKKRPPNVQDRPNFRQHCLLSMTLGIGVEGAAKLLDNIEIIEKGKRLQRQECTLKLKIPAVFQNVFTLKGVARVSHITCMSSNIIAVSGNRNNIVLTDTATGDTLYCVDDSHRLLDGLHAATNRGELINIDKEYNIKILSENLKTKSTFIKKAESTWRPRCIHCTPSSGDILVGMTTSAIFGNIGKVERYNTSGELTHTKDSHSFRILVI